MAEQRPTGPPDIAAFQRELPFLSAADIESLLIPPEQATGFDDPRTKALSFLNQHDLENRRPGIPALFNWFENIIEGRVSPSSAQLGAALVGIDPLTQAARGFGDFARLITGQPTRNELPPPYKTPGFVRDREL